MERFTHLNLENVNRHPGIQPNLEHLGYTILNPETCHNFVRYMANLMEKVRARDGLWSSESEVQGN